MNAIDSPLLNSGPGIQHCNGRRSGRGPVRIPSDLARTKHQASAIGRKYNSRRHTWRTLYGFRFIGPTDSALRKVISDHDCLLAPIGNGQQAPVRVETEGLYATHLRPGSIYMWCY